MDYVNYDETIELVDSAFDIIEEIGFDGSFTIYEEAVPIILETDAGDRYVLDIVNNKYRLLGAEVDFKNDQPMGAG